MKFDGGMELAKALEQISERVSRKFIREALVEAAEPCRKTMSQLAPRGTDGGVTLRNEIVTAPARGQDSKEIAVAVGMTVRAFYGSFLEFGTAHITPRPFMRPAFDQTWQRSLQILSADLWTSLASKGVQRTAGTLSALPPTISTGRTL